jgi:hypothetical protein
MLLPYNSEPETGSRIPSMSTGGAAMKAMMNTLVAVKRQGIMITPNQPMYKRFSVEVIHSQKRAQRLEFSRRSKIAVIVLYYK